MRARNLFYLVFTTANSSLILYGVLALLLPGILLEPFSQNVYQLPADAIEATAYLEALFRLLGFFNLVLGLLGLLLLVHLRSSKETWLLWVVIVSTTLAYLGPIVFDNTVGSIGGFEIVEHILFGLVIIVGGGEVLKRVFKQSTGAILRY